MKKSKAEEVNVTIAAGDTESVASLDSTSVPASPQSVMSYSSEVTHQSSLYGADDSSNDGLVIVDDAHATYQGAYTGLLNPPKWFCFFSLEKLPKLVEPKGQQTQ